MAQHALGKHLIVELHGLAAHICDDPIALREHVESAVRASKLVMLDSIAHRFTPHGVTLLIILAESHIALHTWPEYSYAALDIFTCSGEPWEVLHDLKARWQVERMEVRELDRGILE